MRCNVGGSSSPNSGGGYKLVWTNPNPNVAFADQTITFDKSYANYLIVLNVNVGIPERLYAIVNNKNKDITQTIGFINTSGKNIYRALKGTNNNDGIQFVSSSIAIQAIPLEIYVTNKEIG